VDTLSNQPKYKGDVMSLTMKEVGSILLDGNKSALKANTARRAGSMFNQRVANMIAPKLPMMARM